MTLTYWIHKSNIGYTWEISEGDWTHNFGWTFTLWGANRELNREIKRWKKRGVKTGQSEYWQEYGELR